MSENIMDSKLEENSGNENNSENEVCVFLMTQNGLPVTLDNNAAVTTQEILNKFYHELAKQSIIKGEVCDVKHVCGKFFTLWMTSPYLELQLTPLQRPFVLLNKWDELLLKYAPPDVCKNRDLIEKDEPILSFQRSVYAKKEDETKLEAKDFDVLRLLYEEAKFHILDGRYPYEKYEELAAIQAAIEIDEKIDSQEFFRKHLDKFVPIQYHKMLENNLLGNIFNISLNRMCHKIFEDYKEIIKNAPSNYELFKYKLIRSYLERCWNLPYYGSAYFNGQIEKPVKGFASILSHFDIPIWIAVNRMGIHIIDKKTSELLLSLNYDNFFWGLNTPEEQNFDCIPCLSIQFKNKEDDKILQIFSRQACLIESLITIFSNENSNFDSVDGPLCSERVKSRDQNQISCKLNRLSLKSCC